MSGNKSGDGMFIELRPGSAGVLAGGAFVRVRLTQDSLGKYDAASRASFRDLVKTRAASMRSSGPLVAKVLIGVRGISARELNLPLNASGDLRQLLQLKLESELPIAPDQLAWGWRQLEPLGSNSGEHGGVPMGRYLVAAIKKEALAEYLEVFEGTGVQPQFTPGCLLRAALVARNSGEFALLEVGAQFSELAVFRAGVPTVLRNLSWGSERMMADRLASVRALEELLSVVARGLIVHISPALPADEAVCGILVGNPIESIRFVSLKGVLTADPPAAFEGLVQLLRQDGDASLISLEGREAVVGKAPARVPAWKKLSLVAVLLVTLLAIPLLEAAILKPRLASRLASLKADRGRLTTIDRQYGFLQHLRGSQPPYLDALYLVAKAAPAGWKLETVSMNRKGEMALRVALRDPIQVDPFRTKMMESGFFSSFIVDEQTVSPDRQKVTLRITAQWKSAEEREGNDVGPTEQELEKARPVTKQSNAVPVAVGKGTNSAPAKASSEISSKP